MGKRIVVVTIGVIFSLLSGFSIDRAESYAATAATSQEISESPLEFVWSKTLIPESKMKRRYYLKVNPAGDNLLVHVSAELDKESNDVPIFVDNFLLDSQGNILWRRHYIDLPLAFHQGLINTIGIQSYRWFDRYEHIPSKKLRYYAWLDEGGYVLWAQALRIDPAYHIGKHEEYSPGIIASLEAKCEDGNCQVDRLFLSEKGILMSGWETIFKLSYHGDANGPLFSHTPVGLGYDYLLLHDKEKDKQKANILRLIRFDSKSHIILSDSKYSFPFLVHARISRCKDGLGMYVEGVDGLQKTLFLIDQEGKEKARQSLRIPFSFHINSLFLPYKYGWLIEGQLDKKSDGDRVLVRLSREGDFIWAHKYRQSTSKFAGIDETNIYFSKQGQLIKFREKSVLDGK